MSALQWRFDNSYSRLPEMFFSRVDPVPVKAPRPVILNLRLAKSMGLDLTALSDEAAGQLFSGNAPPAGAAPLAQAYAGHQFGHFNMLGDGRAVVLGEHICPNGERLDIQLKGSGPTPYSRRGDGRAALGPMLREYVISEAMYSLGIPTTRSLAVVMTGEPVYREDVLPGAVLTRIAASHLRVGTFQYAAAGGDPAGLAALVDYTIERHDSELKNAENPALGLLRAVILRQAKLVVEWMRVGFIHGVMNTDNVTISGETIDYGPCAFMDSYDPATTFSSIDHGGRYGFANQARMAQWNLARFAEALLPLLDSNQKMAIERAEEEINGFGDLFQGLWRAMMGRKLGLFDVAPEDESLIDDLLTWMRATEADYTNTFRALATGSDAQGDAPWQQRWRARLERQSRPIEDAFALMQSVSPAYIPRNHAVEAALAAAVENGDMAPFHRLLDVLAEPYRHRDGFEIYESPPPPGAGDYQTFCGT